jgi:hypothetical protein
MGRITKYCVGRAERPPELGAIGRFLQTVAHSRRRAGSVTLQAFKRLLAQWPRSDWLVDDSGAIAAFRELTDRYRNRAAHTAEVTEDDFVTCREFVTGTDGILWKLLSATEAASLRS